MSGMSAVRAEFDLTRALDAACMRAMFDAVGRTELPRHRVGAGEVAGRSGTLAMQDAQM